MGVEIHAEPTATFLYQLIQTLNSPQHHPSIVCGHKEPSSIGAEGHGGSTEIGTESLA